MRSLRVYLISFILSIICLGFFLSALHGYRDSVEKANELFDDELMEMIRQLQALIDHREASSVPPTLFSYKDFFQIISNNQLIQYSRTAESPLNIKLEPGFHFISYQKKRWRILISKHENMLIIVGRQADIYNEIIDTLIVNAILPVLWSLPILAVIIWIVISLGLAPLVNLARLLSNKSSNDLSCINPQSYPNELKVIIHSLNSFMSELDHAYKREKQFASDAAHELKTPISALKVGLYNLTEKHEIDTDLLVPIKSNLDKLNQAVEQILILHRLTPQLLEKNKEMFDLKQLAQEVIINLYQLASEKDQEIELISEKIHYHGSRFGFETIFKNLIENAIKYTSIKSTIRVQIKKHKNQYMIYVEDSGEGICEKEYDRIFDRFYRSGGDCHASLIEGSGLGLSIVKDIVLLHDGEIKAEKSKSLGGLKISICLPLIH